MIKSVKIENFQSHKDTQLNLHKGVNTIIGPSDSGKTAILRAINWVVNNRPSGEVFRRHGSKNTLAQIVLDNTRITRAKEKKEGNIYCIEYLRGDEIEEQTFKAFGQDVPKEISKELRLTDINTQRQMDAPFLLSTSPGEVGRILNRIVQLDEIDYALKNITSIVKKEHQDLKIAHDRVELFERDLKALNWIPEVQGRLTNLEALNGHSEGLRRQFKALKALIEGYRTQYKSLKEYDNILVHEAEVDRLMGLQKLLDKQKSTTTKLVGLLAQVYKTKVSIETFEKALINTEKKYHKLMPNTCPLCEQKIKK